VEVPQERQGETLVQPPNPVDIRSGFVPPDLTMMVEEALAPIEQAPPPENAR